MPQSAEKSTTSRPRTPCAPACGPMLATALLLAAQPVRGGDILRGGANSNNPVNRPAGPSTGAAEAAASRANAKDTLARTSRAVEAVQRAQSNAMRAASAAANNAGADPNHPGFQLPDVPNGLTLGGLQPAAGAGTSAALWTGAFLPTQTTGSGKTQVNIRQTSQQAVLNWKTFNVGKDTSVHFDQSAGGENAGQWIAFNKVSDPSGSPSQILGSITAPGQVYVINQNGIIFGGGSQINVHTLVASSLPVNDALIEAGLLNQQTSAQFLFSALPQAGATPFTPPPLPESGRPGDVTVQAGAQLFSPSNASNVGGRIALVGPNVTNAGTIRTPDGQTILAAGLQVGFSAHSSDDPSLRGLDVFIGKVADPASPLAPYAGTATNSGLIESLRGSTILAGKDVKQLAAIGSSTSVALNGRIDLLANYNAVNNTVYDPIGKPNIPAWLYGSPGAPSTGTVTLGPGSITRILPEWGSAEKVIGSQLSLRSQVNLQGNIIHLDDGAMIHAPNGIVNLSAGVWDAALGTVPQAGFIRAGGQIYIGRDSLISVAGTTDADSPLSNYILTVTLRASELADSPLQRAGLLRGGDVTVDLRKTGTWNGRAWAGTPLADLTGYLNLIERSVDELTVGGGSVNLNSGGSVIIRKGADIDVSAGWTNYSGGFVETTRLLRYGQLIDIATATPDRIYDSVFTGEFTESHPRWNIEKTYRVPWMTGGHSEEAYLHGANAGLLALSGSSMALDGAFRGSAISGLRQKETPATGGTLKLDFENQQVVTGTGTGITISPTPPAITFSDNPQQSPAGPFALNEDGTAQPLREDRVNRAVLPTSWLAQDGFASLEVVNPDGSITVPRGLALNAPALGSITLSGANVSVLGSLAAPGGKVAINTWTISPSVSAALKLAGNGQIPDADPRRGNFVLGPGAGINTAGLIVDNRIDSPTFSQQPNVTNGGTVSVHTYHADLAAGSLIDVSGGVNFGPRGERTFGRAGTIEIIAGQDSNLLAVDGGTLHLGGTLQGYSGTATGGTLSLQAQMIQIGGALLSPASLRLDPGFFSQGGFSTFNLTGLGESDGNGGFLPGLLVANGVEIAPKVLSWLAIPYGGPGGTLNLVPFEKDEYLRAPAHLNFAATGVRDDLTNLLAVRGDLVLGRGASIATDALGSVSLKGDTVAVLGSITAPGGSIAITGAGSYPQAGTPPDFAQTTVWLAPGSRLSTAGKVLTWTDRFGHLAGSVLSGGSISVSGNLVAEAGAVLDVSGTTGKLNFHPVQLGLGADGRPLVPGAVLLPANSGLTAPLWQSLAVNTRLDSNGGSITLKGGQMLLTDATLLGHAGGPTALGGSFLVSSGKFLPQTTAETNLVVKQSGRNLPDHFSANGPPIGLPVRGADGVLIPAMGYFTADTFTSGGFDSLSLGGNVEFRGDVTIRAGLALRVASGGVIRADGNVNLTADHIILGQAFLPPLRAEDKTILFSRTSDGAEIFVPPTTGTGTLTARARLIDVGTLSLQGIGLTSLNAARGEIRGNGTLDAAGVLNLTAGQIYPTTGSAFNILVYDAAGAPGTLNIAGGSAQSLPLSAAGRLNLFASVINQGGVLRAPFGSIQLGWDGTGTAPFKDPVTGSLLSLPVTTDLTLAAGSQTSVSGIDRRTGLAISVPYGYVTGGGAWIDPSGVDITALGPPERRIGLSAKNLITASGSLIDIRGGGDLYGYRWVPGIGGSQDVLLANSSFAILPGYDSLTDPYAPYNPLATTTGDDPGYVNSTLKSGDSIYLAANGQLPAGTYTLLPARYALQPGAFLVTPLSGLPIGSFQNPDGSAVVSGYRFNTIDPGTGAAVQSRYELASGEVVRQRSAYDDFSANTFFREAAAALNAPVPRLPEDSGRLVLQAANSAALNGSVAAKALAAGRGGLVDISSAADIFIGGGARTSGPAGSLFLRTEQLNAMGAESLLIGGVRTYGTDGASVSVNTGRLTLENPGATLSGTDVILVAKYALTLAEGASILSSGSVPGRLDNLIFGDSVTAGSGNGLLVRMSADPSAASTRLGVTPGGDPLLTVGAGVRLEGQSLTLDSTAGTSLSPDAALLADAINLFSGRISLADQYTGPAPGGNGLVLSGLALRTLEQRARDLNLSSYSSLDLYGTGNVAVDGSLRLSAGQIRGFGQDGGGFVFAAPSILLDNRSGASTTAAGAATGNLIFNAGVITLGSGDLRIDQFNNLGLNAASGLVVSGTGSLTASGNISGATPVLTGTGGATHGIHAGGSLVLDSASGAPIASTGLGAEISLSGADVTLRSDVIFSSGRISVTALTGDIGIGGLLSAAGTTRNFLDTVRRTNGGEIELTSQAGSIRLLSGSVVDVSAQSGGGNAGSFTASAAQGAILTDGVLLGKAGEGGTSGRASFDMQASPTLSFYNKALDAGGFLESRSFRVRTGDVLVDSAARARTFRLSADAGSITVSDVIDASGAAGGEIILSANGSLTLLPAARLTVAAQDFSNAGKGGSVTLQSGSSRDGVVPAGTVLDLQSGSVIDLSVASLVAGNLATPGSSAFNGKFSGTLQLRAPRSAANDELGIASIGSTITGGSSILAEGYQLTDLSASGVDGLITSAVQTGINTSAAGFMSHEAGIITRLLGADAQGLGSVFVLAPGAEIINRSGNLTLGTANSTSTEDWSLHDFRYGAKAAPGMLTLRASGDLVFNNALSDGFTPAAAAAAGQRLWLGTAMAINPALPANTQSWSYHLTAGADLSAASSGALLPGTGTGSLLLGKFLNANLVSGDQATTASAVQDRFQVIRTGTGGITISAARDVRLNNVFASIYTAGARLAEPQSIYITDDFGIPLVVRTTQPNTPELGAPQQNYAPSWTMAGGNVTVSADRNIGRYTMVNGQLTVDTSRQLPDNWLYRRGRVDESTGNFGTTGVSNGIPIIDRASSTTWWIDFSNFFQGFGALGGGNVTLAAGNDVINADAVVPTNARMPGRDAAGNPVPPDASRLVELGGGDIRVTTGRNIDGGLYYVERGDAVLTAGGAVTTNAARSPSRGILGSSSLPPQNNDLIQSRNPEIYDPLTWMPTGFFLGRGNIGVTARGDILTGPVANTFLLPQGLNNKFWYKTWFSTYGQDSSFDTVSLGGGITYRLAVNLPARISSVPTLLAWMSTQNLSNSQDQPESRASNYQPWIRLVETSVAGFDTASALLPGTVRGTAYAGDINVVGDMTLSPSATGTLELLSSGAINGINATGPTRLSNNGPRLQTYISSRINLSDASPAAIPGIATPFVDQATVGTTQVAQRTTTVSGAPLVRLLSETGSYTGVAGSIAAKNALHAPGILHAGDTSPVLLYGAGGDISGLTLFSAKAARVIAGRDITDVGLYIQNTAAGDISLVSSGRDLIPFNESSALRSIATNVNGGNVLTTTASLNSLGGSTNAATGDLQISGPGVMEVLAGGRIDLGTGANFQDGTGVGITSIGNLRNPGLPQMGADLIIMAGVNGPAGQGPATSLTVSSLDLANFVSQYAADSIGSESAYLQKLEVSSTANLTDEQRAIVALEVFFDLLKQSGRDAAVSGSYDAGYAAIDALFGPAASATAEILDRSRDIRTTSGGAISIAAPGGGLTMASQIFGNPLAPPGIVTEAGGSISIFTEDSVSLGQARIFTLRGGNITIWSSTGDIAAGSAAKTVVSAPPTRVLIDTTSADVNTDLAGLATGGGIGVLATVANVPPGDVDLIAPVGAVDAGDAGIRSSGNLTIAAAQVLNASNIAVAGTSAGTPAAAPAAPAVSTPAPAPPPATNSNPAADAASAANAAQQQGTPTEIPVSVFTVEVIGYGGSDPAVEPASGTPEDEEEKEKRRREALDGEKTQNGP